MPPMSETPSERQRRSAAKLDEWADELRSGQWAGTRDKEIAGLRTLLAAKDAEIAALTGERDRQYEYNVAQIAKQAELEAQIAALRSALSEALPCIYSNRKQVDTDTFEPIRSRARAALEMSGGMR